MSLCEATTCVPIDMGIHMCVDIYIYAYIYRVYAQPQQRPRLRISVFHIDMDIP